MLDVIPELDVSGGAPLEKRDGLRTAVGRSCGRAGRRSPAFRCPSRSGWRDTGAVSSEESTAPDLVELMRGLSDAPSVDETIRYYAPDAVYDMSKLGMGVFEGRL